MLKFLVRLAVFGGLCTSGFAAEKDFLLESLEFKNLCTVLEKSQNEQKIILDKISQRLDADQSTLDTQLDKISQRLDVDQFTLDTQLDKISQRLDVDQFTLNLSEPKVVSSELNKSVEIHKLQDETYDKLKENSELRLQILAEEKKVLEGQLFQLKSLQNQNQTQAKNYTMMDRARDGFILLGMAGAAIGGAYLCYKFYEEGGNVFRVKVYY